MYVHGLRRLRCGQSIVEYALLIGLAALAVVVIISLVGLTVQRVFGVTAGALGGTGKSTSPHTIEITTALCAAVKSSGLTGLWVVGLTDADVSTLSAGTDQAIGTGVIGMTSPVEANGPNGFKFHPLLANQANTALCPKAVVIQSSDGAIATSPITAVEMP